MGYPRTYVLLFDQWTHLELFLACRKHGDFLVHYRHVCSVFGGYFLLALRLLRILYHADYDEEEKWKTPALFHDCTSQIPENLANVHLNTLAFLAYNVATWKRPNFLQVRY